MLLVRTALAGIGALVLAYGVWLMVHWQSTRQLVQVIEWAAAGVVIHDGVLAPLAVGVGWLLRRRGPRRLAAPVGIALMLAATTTASGFAVLTRSHGGGANHTLLDRNYPLGLLVALAIILVFVALGFAAARGWSRARGPREAGRWHE